MSDPKVIDKRNEPRPEKQKFRVFPTCRTCIHFDNFILPNGQASKENICVFNPPVTHAQIRGEDENGNVIFAYSHGWPIVYPGQRCSKHVDREAN